MKKSVLILGAILITFSLTAFGYINWVENEKDLECSAEKDPAEIAESETSEEVSFTMPMIEEISFSIQSKGFHTITRSKLQGVRSISEILPEEVDWTTYPIRSVKLSTDIEGLEFHEMGKGLELNEAQIQLLRSTAISQSFILTAKCEGSHPGVDVENFELNYIITVVPENEAEYPGGYDELINYIKKETEKETAHLLKDQLKFGRLTFIVSSSGNITDLELNSSSGYTDLDEKIFELLMDLPKAWIPATNAIGDKVDQELELFFGRMGC